MLSHIHQLPAHAHYTQNLNVTPHHFHVYEKHDDRDLDLCGHPVIIHTIDDPQSDLHVLLHGNDDVPLLHANLHIAVTEINLYIPNIAARPAEIADALPDGLLVPRMFQYAEYQHHHRQLRCTFKKCRSSTPCPFRQAANPTHSKQRTTT